MRTSLEVTFNSLWHPLKIAFLRDSRRFDFFKAMRVFLGSTKLQKQRAKVNAHLLTCAVLQLASQCTTPNAQNQSVRIHINALDASETRLKVEVRFERQILSPDA